MVIGRTANRKGAGRRFGGWLALLAVALFVVAPFAQPIPASATTIIEICTAHGIVSIPMPDEEGDPSPFSGMPKCPACGLAALGKALPKALGAPTVALPRTAGIAATILPAEADTAPAAAILPLPPSRAPPVPV